MHIWVNKMLRGSNDKGVILVTRKLGGGMYPIGVRAAPTNTWMCHDDIYAQP